MDARARKWVAALVDTAIVETLSAATRRARDRGCGSLLEVDNAWSPVLASSAYWAAYTALNSGQSVGVRLAGLKLVARDGTRAGLGRTFVKETAFSATKAALASVPTRTKHQHMVLLTLPAAADVTWMFLSHSHVSLRDDLVGLRYVRTSRPWRRRLVWTSRSLHVPRTVQLMLWRH